MFRFHCVLLTTGLAISIGTAAQNVPEFRTYTISEAPAELRPSIRHGDLIIISLQDAALSELTRELGRGGPSRAIISCHLDATAAAYRVAREEGVAAGRTSDRLRNPTNAPRPWAASIVEQNAGRTVAGLDGFVVDLGDRVGLMRPIAHRSMCGPCHGQEDKLVPQVRAELRERYPLDRATGFRDGELRGWYWVELPKK